MSKLSPELQNSTKLNFESLKNLFLSMQHPHLTFEDAARKIDEFKAVLDLKITRGQGTNIKSLFTIFLFQHLIILLFHEQFGYSPLIKDEAEIAKILSDKETLESAKCFYARRDLFVALMMLACIPDQDGLENISSDIETIWEKMAGLDGLKLQFKYSEELSTDLNTVCCKITSKLSKLVNEGFEF
jgi:hypothetical protein